MKDGTLVVMVDWSASSTRGPAKPSPDRCWIAHAVRGEKPASRPPPEYFRTRAECEARIAAIVSAHSGPALVGFDFPIGYPRALNGEPVLPEGLALCELLHRMVEDREDGANNRFEVAAALNDTIRSATAMPEGPFWGHPVGRSYAGLPFRKTRRTGVGEFRAVEKMLRAKGKNIQSAWKLMGAGSVGSQAILGMAAVHRLLQQLGPRARLWPFQPPGPGPDGVTIAEIWPSLADHSRADHEIKDARQVLALRDEVMGRGGEVELLREEEGWIWGVKAIGM